MVLHRLFAKAKPRSNFPVRAATHHHANESLLVERQAHDFKRIGRDASSAS